MIVDICHQTWTGKKKVNILYKTRSLGGPSGPLISSFAAFGRSGWVTHAMMWSLDSVIGTLLIFVDKSKRFHRQIQKNCWQIQKRSSTNPINFDDKSKKNCPEMHKFRNPKIHIFWKIRSFWRQRISHSSFRYWDIVRDRCGTFGRTNERTNQRTRRF